jgi:hypothetical protein
MNVHVRTDQGSGFRSTTRRIAAGATLAASIASLPVFAAGVSASAPTNATVRGERIVRISR